MADSDRQEKIEQFLTLTGVNAERAKFYLESSRWELDTAISTFYEDDDDDQPDVSGSAQQSFPSLGAATGTTKASQSSRFATIGSMKESEKSDSEEEGQAFYAGGSEESHEVILGPPRKKGSGREFVESLFKSAKEHGAKEVGLDEAPEKGKTGPIFQGAGYRLGETDDSSEVVFGARNVPRPQEKDVNLTFWKDGFSIDDGPLRDFNDPENRDFLQAVQKGEIPKELLMKGREVHVNMVDKHTENFVQQKPKMKAFTGEGRMLGSPTPKVVSHSSAAGRAESRLPTSNTRIEVDSARPVTQLQVRLADGSRIVAKFNHNHTVRDVRNYITNQRPEFAVQNFVLMTTFPNKELTDENQTLEDAKLINAVVVQRLK